MKLFTQSMMKSLLIFSLFSFMALPAFAQNAPIDFEAGGNGADWTWTVFENDSNPAVEIVANPNPSGENTSATVAKFTALQTGQPFAGCETMHGADIGTFNIGPSNSTISIMVWKTEISDIGIKLVAADGAALPEIRIPNTMVNQWEKITFDFSAQNMLTYDQIVIFPDFNQRAQDNVIYFDNITFGDQIVIEEPMTAAPDPTQDPSSVISMFSNVYTDVPVNTWRTEWSNATLEDIQIAGNDTKKYTALDFVGIETVDANLIDATAMTHIHVDMWTPNMTTFRIKLVDFGPDGLFDGGDDSEHELVFENPAQGEWVSLDIPLVDFAGLTNRTSMAQMILSGLPTGGGTVYIDNVFFFDNLTSVSSFKENDVKLFPNPVQSKFTISTEKNLEEVRIYDALGSLVLNKRVLDNTSNFDIAHLSNGIYVVVAIIDGETLVDRLIKN